MSSVRRDGAQYSRTSRHRLSTTVEIWTLLTRVCVGVAGFGLSLTTRGRPGDPSPSRCRVERSARRQQFTIRVLP